jgi:hypothetical protein
LIEFLSQNCNLKNVLKFRSFKSIHQMSEHLFQPKSLLTKELMMGMRVGSGSGSVAMQQMRQAQSAQASVPVGKQLAAAPVAAQALDSANQMQSQAISALLSSLGANVDLSA